jgi:hypothetical protein
MGAETAPLSRSGSWPTWMARVAKPRSLFFFMIWVSSQSRLMEDGRLARPAGRGHPASLEGSNPTFKNLFREIAFG